MLVAAGGITGIVWDLWLGKYLRLFRQRRETKEQQAADRRPEAECDAPSSARTTVIEETVKLRQLPSIALSTDALGLNQRRYAEE